MVLTFASISRLTSSRQSRSFVRVRVLAATSRDTHSLLPPRSPHISLLSACAVRLVGRSHSSEIERTLSKHNLVVSLSWARHCRSVILRASCVSTPDVDVVAGFLLRGCCRCECLCGLVWSRDHCEQCMSVSYSLSCHLPRFASFTNSVALRCSLQLKTEAIIRILRFRSAFLELRTQPAIS